MRKLDDISFYGHENEELQKEYERMFCNMTQEEKQLLIKDLCARLPYEVKLRYVEDLVVKKESHTITLNNIYLEHIINGDVDIKPYLRPMSSMTEKEKKEFDDFCVVDEFAWEGNAEIGYKNQAIIMSDGIDWLLAHHFDYRGLIEKGLALESPKDMYKYENN